MSDIAIRVENLCKLCPSTWLRAGHIGPREQPYKVLPNGIAECELRIEE